MQFAHPDVTQALPGIRSSSTDAEDLQVLNKSQAVKLEQLTGKYQDAVMALCAEVAGTGPGHQGLQSLGGVTTYGAFTMTDIACPLVQPATVAAHLSYMTFALSCQHSCQTCAMPVLTFVFAT